jgi:hypothetical protein
MFSCGIETITLENLGSIDYLFLRITFGLICVLYAKSEEILWY